MYLGGSIVQNGVHGLEGLDGADVDDCTTLTHMLDSLAGNGHVRDDVDLEGPL